MELLERKIQGVGSEPGKHGVSVELIQGGVMGVAEPSEIDCEAGAVIKIENQAALFRESGTGNKQQLTAHAKVE